MILVGLGIQGKKRLVIAGDDVIATVDPHISKADFVDIKQVPLGDFDAALVCTPDQVKIELLEYLLSNGKHALVEKPILAPDNQQIKRLLELSRKNNVTCYTAYNHRFEPHVVNLKNLIDSGELGKIYRARFFYGNGTARDVKLSKWRDQGAGVLPDLGSHLLDMILFLFGELEYQFVPWSANCFENRAFDHIIFGASGDPVLELEATLLSWRNSFSADVYGELGSAHIHSLCKWGPSTFTVYNRVFPSGKPDRKSQILEQVDPTWAIEYEYFTQLCLKKGTNLEHDLRINSILNDLTKTLLEEQPA